VAFRSWRARRCGLAVATAVACVIACTTLITPAAAATARSATHRSHHPAPPWNPLAHPALFSGGAFDICATPRLEHMRAWWRTSPYQALGLYIGGLNWGCGSGRTLDRPWVEAVSHIGWRLIPIYVGRQAPCVRQPRLALMDPKNLKTVQAQATEAATDAANVAASLGLLQSSAIYFDLESYKRGDADCAAAARTFIGTWVRVLHARGYLAGLYASAGSGIADFAANPGWPAPDAVWIARWNGARSLSDSALPDSAWSRHQRIKQYTNGHKETYAGVSLVVDKDVVDGPVARVG